MSDAETTKEIGRVLNTGRLQYMDSWKVIALCTQANKGTIGLLGKENYLRPHSQFTISKLFSSCST
jgi:hypothetical protein